MWADVLKIAVFCTICRLVSGTTEPVSVVLTGSMEPEIAAGDLLFNVHDPVGTREYQVHDIVTFNLANHPVPIVHRIIHVYRKQDGHQCVLTKGEDRKSVV